MGCSLFGENCNIIILTFEWLDMFVILLRSTSTENVKSIGAKLPEIRACQNHILTEQLYLMSWQVLSFFSVFLIFVRIMLADVWNSVRVSPMTLPGH